MPEKLPEEFAPTGPKLSRFPIQPAPPVRPRLFSDEARFALRLSVLAGGTEFVAWAWLAASGRRREVLALAALRLLRPLWARLGTRVPRPAVAFALLGLALFAICASVLSPVRLVGIAAIAAGLPALGDLCATCIGDSVTVERRAAAYAWLDMGTALGGVLGFALGARYGSAALLCAIPALAVAASGIFALHDRGTPRSAWPLKAYLSVLASPLAAQLCLMAFLCGALSRAADVSWLSALAPLAGMAISARIEPRMPNALWLPRLAVLLAAGGAALGWAPASLLGLGVMFAAIPASVARGAGEMERPLASSLAWSALFAGAAAGAVLRF